MPPNILLTSLSKHFKVPVRESGLKASFGSLVKRKFRTVKAVDEINFTIDAGCRWGSLLSSRWHSPSQFQLTP